MEDCHADVVKQNKDSIFKLFSNLTGEKNQNPKHCLDLVKNLTGHEYTVGSGSNLEYSLKRLVRGLGSTRLHTQCGCFAALTCVLKYEACTAEDVVRVLDKEQHPPQGATTSEIKAFATACVLACGAIVHSGTFVGETSEMQTTVLKKLIEAGKKKSYLSSVIHRLLADVVNTVDNQQFKEVVWPIFKSDLLDNLDECGADGFYLLLVSLRKHNKTVSKFLQKKSTTPESTVEKIITSLLANSVKCDHPVYDVVGQVFSTNTKSAVGFWSTCVNENAKISFHKDAILLTLFGGMLENVSETSTVPKLLVPKLIEVFIKVLSFKKAKNSKDEDCSAVAKSALNSMTTALCSDSTSNETRFATIKKLLFYPANMKFEMKTGTKCVHVLASTLNDEFTKKLVGVYRAVVSGEVSKIIDDEGTEENWTSKEKQTALYVFTKTLNHPSLKKEIDWKLDQIKFIFDIGFLKKFQLASEVQKCAKECFYKAVTLQMPSLKDLVQLLDELALHLNENIKNENLKVSEEVVELWEKTFSVVKTLQKKSNDKLFVAVHVLLIYMGFHLFLDSELAKGGIEELLSCYEHLREVHKKKKKKEDEGPHWTEVTVDLILSLLSRENKLWRHVVSCIFPQVVPHLTPTALHQIIDALDPKNKNDVLKHIDSDDSESEEESEEGSESSLSEGSEEEEEEFDDEGKVNDQLRMAVRNALGYSAAQTDEESIDMDQMGEEEEKRLNEGLSQAFRLYRNKTQGKRKKQTKEEEALTHFRLRVLDLVEMYATNSASMGGCLDLLLPLLDVLEFSIKDQHQLPLQNRVDSILKHISAVKNFSETNNVTQKVIKDVFEAVISRKEIPALVFVEMSPRISDCTTFLVRCSQLVPKETPEVPLVDEYDSMLKTFFQARDLKLPISMFQAVLKMTWTGNLKLAETLFQFLAVSNIRIFKKMKIIELLRIFYKNGKLHGSLDESAKAELSGIEAQFANEFATAAPEYDSKAAEKMYLAFFSNVFTLINLIHTCGKRHREESEKAPPWKKLIATLSTMEIVNGNKKTRAQLTNLANIFNVSLPPKEQSKRKRTASESSARKNEDESEEEEKDEPEKKKPKKKISADKMKLKKEARRAREEISAEGLEMIRFSTIDAKSLLETEVDDEDATEEKKRKTKDVAATNGDVKPKHKKGK